MRPRALLLLFVLALAPGTGSAQSAGDGGSGAKEKVTGIGGLFFRARDPQALSRWYLTHLGVTPVPASYEESPWRQEAGPTVFAPFPDTPATSEVRSSPEWSTSGSGTSPLLRLN